MTKKVINNNGVNRVWYDVVWSLEEKIHDCVLLNMMCDDDFLNFHHVRHHHRFSPAQMLL